MSIVLHAKGIGVVILTTITVPAMGVTQTGVLFSSLARLTNGDDVFIRDASGNTINAQLTAISGNSASITTLPMIGNSPAGTTVLAGAYVYEVEQSSWMTSIIYAGSGSDLAFTPGASGVTTLTRDMFYSSMGPWPSGSSATVFANGWRIFCNGKVDLTNAPASAINFDSTTPGNAGLSSGAAPSLVRAPKQNTMGQGTDGTKGGSSTTTIGHDGSIPTYGQLGGLSTSSGNGGAGSGGSGGSAAGKIGTLQSSVGTLSRFFLTATGPAFGGTAGCSGGAGGGSGSALGGSGGGGGPGGGCVGLWCAELYRDSSTAAGAISANGSAGGAGGTSVNSGAGGGGAGAGGCGGYVYLSYFMLSGTAVTGLIRANGGAAAAGGNGVGAGVGGGGSSGGYGGHVTVVNSGANSSNEYFGTACTLGTQPSSGTTGGAAGTAGTLAVTI